MVSTLHSNMKIVNVYQIVIQLRSKQARTLKRIIKCSYSWRYWTFRVHGQWTGASYMCIIRVNPPLEVFPCISYMFIYSCMFQKIDYFCRWKTYSVSNVHITMHITIRWRKETMDPMQWLRHGGNTLWG